MSTELVTVSAAPLPSTLVETLEKAQDYAAGAKAEATKRADRAAWTDFSTWCGENGLAAMPAAPPRSGCTWRREPGSGRRRRFSLG